MSDLDKLKAAGKIAVGAAKAAGGIATATGHGMVGAFLKSHHCMQGALRYGKYQFDQGVTQIKEGVKELRRP